MDQLILFLILLALGYTCGRISESRHYRSILEREKKWLHLPVISMRTLPQDDRQIAKVELVSGGVVISVDYFKRFLAGMHNLFGRRMSSYETLLDRARREAILRLKESALGADVIMNLRLESIPIGKEANKSVAGVEILAYATAITFDKSAPRTTPARIAPPAEATQLYALVFKGEIAPGKELSEVKTKIANLFNIPLSRCDELFLGRPVVIKRRLSMDTARQLKTAFERTGAIIHIKRMKEPT